MEAEFKGIANFYCRAFAEDGLMSNNEKCKNQCKKCQKNEVSKKDTHK